MSARPCLEDCGAARHGRRRHVAVALAGLVVAMLLAGTGCARKPITDPGPVPACGQMPPMPLLCNETLLPNASPDDVKKCYQKTILALAADDLALRAQFAPCAH